MEKEAQPVATVDRINEVYYGKILNAKAHAVARERVAWICQRVRGSAVLDIGCSQGIVSILLARAGKTVTGIDINKESIEYATRELASEDESTRQRVNFIHGDALHQSLKENGFDTVIMGQLLEHVPEPEAFLALARRVCKPDGRVIITVPFGLLDHPDHIHTFYLYSFCSFISPFFSLEELNIIGKRICFLGSLAETNRADECDTEPAIGEQWHRRIHELSEAEFGRMEREGQQQLSTRQRRIERLETKIDLLENDKQALETKIEGLKTDKQALQNRIIAIKSEYSEKNKVMYTSVAFKVGKAMIAAVRPSKATIALPFRLWRIYRDFRSGGQQPPLQRAPAKKHKKLTLFSRQPIEIEEARILFMPTNGVGLGHVTRLLAMARRLKTDPRIAECVFLTTSDALSVIGREGFVVYHYPSAKALTGTMQTRTWGKDLRDLLVKVMANHGINVFVFDGVNPYTGAIDAIRKRKGLFKVWVRRGMLKEGIEDKFNAPEHYFDLQLIPTELGQEITNENSKMRIMVPPMVFLDRSELLARQDVINELGLDPGKKTVFVQFGSGNLGDKTTEIELVIDTLRRFDNVQLVLAESLISRRDIRTRADIRILKDYPRSRYYAAFDLAISASGYNSFHELLYFGIPSIFVPSVTAAADDQAGRAMIAQEASVGLCLSPLTALGLHEGVERLLDEPNNAAIRERCLSLFALNGSDIAARVLVESVFQHP